MRVWDFKGKEENLQEDGKSKCLVNKALSFYAETMGHREQALPNLPYLTTPSPYSL